MISHHTQSEIIRETSPKTCDMSTDKNKGLSYDLSKNNSIF